MVMRVHLYRRPGRCLGGIAEILIRSWLEPSECPGWRGKEKHVAFAVEGVVRLEEHAIRVAACPGVWSFTLLPKVDAGISGGTGGTFWSGRVDRVGHILLRVSDNWHLICQLVSRFSERKERTSYNSPANYGRHREDRLRQGCRASREGLWVRRPRAAGSEAS